MPDDAQKKPLPKRERSVCRGPVRAANHISMVVSAHQSQRRIAYRHAADSRHRKGTLHSANPLRVTRDNASWRARRFRRMLLHQEQPNFR
jgi:hypothetical protein